MDVLTVALIVIYVSFAEAMITTVAVNWPAQMISDLSSVQIISHPLIQHKVTCMRDANCEARRFGQLLKDCGFLLGYVATKDLPIKEKRVQTPVALAAGWEIAVPSPAIVAVLRSGLVMAEGLRELFEVSSLGHIGVTRRSGKASDMVLYFANVPLYDRQPFFLVDPVIATGETLTKAADVLKDNGIPGGKITAIALVGAEKGIRTFAQKHPDIRLLVCACDPVLDEDRYVSPGVGNISDRLFGITAE